MAGKDACLILSILVFTAPIECSDAGPAPAGTVQPAAPTAAAHAAESHANEAAELQQQPSPTGRSACQHGGFQAATRPSSAVPLPPQLWYKPRQPSPIHQPFLASGHDPRGNAAQPHRGGQRRYGEQRHDGKRRRTVWQWDQYTDAAECLSVLNSRYEHNTITKP